MSDLQNTPLPSEPSSTRGQDLLLLTLGAPLWVPLWMARGLIALVFAGRLYARQEHGAGTPHDATPRFAGAVPGRALGGLPAVVAGRLAWVGPRQPAGGARPGLVSRQQVREGVRMAATVEAAAQHAPTTGGLAAHAGLLLRALVVGLFGGQRVRPSPGRWNLFGITIDNISRTAALDWIVARARGVHTAHVAFVNAHCLNTAWEQAGYRAGLQNADLVLPDGTGVQAAFRIHGLSMRENLNGTDLFPALCERLAREGLSLFLLGAQPGVAAEVARVMRQRVPGLQVAGTHHGYFTEAQAPTVIDEINLSGADVLLVAKGVPAQELWIEAHRQQLQPRVCMGVGGLFDFYSGRIPRAPLWLRELGMEWTWRLLQEPRRMWRRYVLGNPLFLFRAWRVRSVPLAVEAPRADPSLLPGKPGLAALRRAHWRGRPRRIARARRLLDVLVSATALAGLAPLLLLVALAIRLESPGPVLFRQMRVGLRGEPFAFWKFRSMYIDAEARKAALMANNEMAGGVLFKMRDDPRVTRVGRFIRRYSIDELPQLWNVLRGDMSLVGPRPALPSEVAQYTVSDRRRLDAEPGITCIWQVSGRSEIPFDEQVELDVEYMHRATLGENVRLLARTVPAVLSARGAY